MSRILIIEDEEAIADLERDYLELSGFEVVVEGDGARGLSRALSEPFDMYILDIMLPGKDGFEICKEIRAVKNSPILMVSARKEDIDKVRGLGLGADDYITKPFSPSEMVARVKAHLKRYERLIGQSPMQEKPVRNEVLEARDLRLDLESHRVWRGGEEIELTQKEFELLAFLLEHPNQVFSKEELFQRIWKMDAMGGAGTVAVHINRIREKIELSATKPQYVQTVWGMGYRFKL